MNVTVVRKMPDLTIQTQENTVTISVSEGENLLRTLTANRIYLTSPCGGKGTCGKCRVRVVQGELPISDVDRRSLSENDINVGFRLACGVQVKTDLTIELAEEPEFDVLTDENAETGEVIEADEYAVAIDIGTTTIALALVSLSTGQTVRTMGELNRQRSFGADVVSRIAASNDGHENELTDLIRNQIQDMLKRLDVKQLSKIAIAGNTTMCHILMGYSCKNLGSYPFEPVNVETIYTDSVTLFGEEIPKCEVIILPGVSTYVGADIVSGLVQCGFHKADNVSVLIDLGTNGEMAIGNKDRILVTSAAAGPAFEGGNITCGTGSVPGAIQAVEIRYKRANIETIQNKTPVGICGSGVVELTAELLKNQIIDETGALEESYLETGFPVGTGLSGQIVCYQRDIREIQMAKSAIFSALTLLTKRFGVSLEEVDKVYLAGGFGFRVNVEKAVSIGLLPKEWKDKILVVGNTALQGAKQVLLDTVWISKAENIINVSHELSLAMDEEFNQLYMDNMFFE